MFPITTNLRFQGFPWVTFVLLSLNVLAFTGETILRANGTFELLTLHYNLMPAKFLLAFSTGYPDLIGNAVVSLFLSMFLHANFMHIITNLAFFFTLGPALEARIGWWRFALFYICAGVVAALVYMASGPTAVASVVGASGAIAGLQGAFLVLWPRARITVLAPFLAFTTNGANVMFSFMAMQAIGIYLHGNASAPEAVGVAYWEHAGGLAYGIIIAICLRWYAQRHGSKDPVVVPPHQYELFDNMLNWLQKGCRRVGLGRSRG